MSTRTKIHVGIVGAGLGGLAAAIGIARAGHKVTILERFAVLEEIGAGIQIPPNSSRILREYGVLEEIEAVSVRPKDLFLRSYRDGEELSKLNMCPTIEKLYGNPYLHVHRADCHRILVERARTLGVQIRLDCTVYNIDFEKAIIRIRGKPDVECDLVLGADGLNSACREILLGHTDPVQPTGDMAYRIVISTEDMVADEELRSLVETPNINYWMGPQSHVVCYLLQGESLYNIVLLCPDTVPGRKNTARADLEEMQACFRDWDPRLRKILEKVKETSKWRLLNSKEMDHWCHPSGRFALLGDACHATLPYLAQGAAQALEDGAILGVLFGLMEHAEHVPEILRIYERIRKGRTTRIIQGSLRQRDIFHMLDGELQQERDRQLRDDAPFEGYPNQWADPAFQKWLFGYDAFEEAASAWRRYQTGGLAGLVD